MASAWTRVRPNGLTPLPRFNRRHTVSSEEGYRWGDGNRCYCEMLLKTMGAQAALHAHTHAPVIWATTICFPERMHELPHFSSIGNALPSCNSTHYTFRPWTGLEIAGSEPQRNDCAAQRIWAKDMVGGRERHTQSHPVPTLEAGATRKKERKKTRRTDGLGLDQRPAVSSSTCGHLYFLLTLVKPIPIEETAGARCYSFWAASTTSCIFVRPGERLRIGGQ